MSKRSVLMFEWLLRCRRADGKICLVLNTDVRADMYLSAMLIWKEAYI